MASRRDRAEAVHGTLGFAQRWTADRRPTEGLCAGDPSELNELSFGAGDSHRGGSTVAIARGEGWRVVYKPRSLAIDSALRASSPSLPAIMVAR